MNGDEVVIALTSADGEDDVGTSASSERELFKWKKISYFVWITDQWIKQIRMNWVKKNESDTE